MKTAGATIQLLRTRHWVKNVAVLTALPFGWMEHGLGCTPAMLLACAAFCLSASAVYALNDVADRQEDLLHPHKKHRPVARGAITPAHALVVAALLAAAALATALLVPNRLFVLFIAGYLLLMVAYTYYLKHEPILDVIIIASGFVIRATGGAVAVNVYISPWLVVCTFTLCLFLGFGKRRIEVYALSDSANAAGHRRTLTQYSGDLLNQLLSTSAGIALVTFMLYIMDTDVHAGQTVVLDKQPLLFTFPLVAYGLFRYAMLIETGKVSGPTDIILKDRILLIVILIWMLTSAAIMFAGPFLQYAGRA